MTDVQEALDQSQFIDLIHGIQALAKGISRRFWKAVAALPNPKRVLGQSGIALDRGNAERKRLDCRAVIHAADPAQVREQIAPVGHTMPVKPGFV
jgi:hypothetical protein